MPHLPLDGMIDALGSESLEVFVRKLRQFDQAFCDRMASQTDFTLRLEVRGNKGEVIHIRIYSDDLEQPVGSQKRISLKRSDS